MRGQATGVRGRSVGDLDDREGMVPRAEVGIIVAGVSLVQRMITGQLYEGQPSA